MADICAQLGSFPPPDPEICCPSPPCNLEFQTKEGSASLCGFSEYTTPSSPPKKYRRQDIGGVQGECNVCSGSPSAASASKLAGFYTFDSSDCSTANTQGVDYGTVAALCAGCIFVGNIAPLPADVAVGPSGSGGVTNVLQRTSSVNTNNGCVAGTNYFNEGGGPGPGHQKALSDEDTEDDAIDRATAPAESGWTSCSSGCTGYKELRGAGDFTLTFRRLQVRIRIPAGTAQEGQNYEATLNIRRRLYGTSDPFVDWAEITDTFTGDEDAERIGPWLTVPVESGYEVEVSTCYNRAYG